MSTIKNTKKSTMNVTSISKFRKKAKSYFDQVIKDHDVLLITRNDGETVVVMTLEQYNAKAETDYLKSNPVNRKHLEESLASMCAGKLQAHTLTDD